MTTTHDVKIDLIMFFVGLLTSLAGWLFDIFDQVNVFFEYVSEFVFTEWDWKLHGEGELLLFYMTYS